MRKYLLVVVLVVAALFVFNACVAEIPREEEETPNSSVTTIYDAIEPIFSAATDSTVSAVVKGIVINAYSNVVQIEDLDGKAGLRVELAKGEELPEVGKVIEVGGTLKKYEKTNEGVVTFKMQDATYDVLDETATPVFNELDEAFFATDNNYKLNTLVEATGLITKVVTGKYPKFYMDIEVGDATKSVVLFSFDNDVKDWINTVGETYEGSNLYVKGYWSKYKDDWEIVARSSEDIPAMSK